MKAAAVILAGGAGTRLRPLSSDENPKQFLPLFESRSLLQLTWGRVAQVLGEKAIFVSTSAAYRGKSIEQLRSLPPDNVIVEPSRRNTAPAIAWCTFFVERLLGDIPIAFLPSDHYISDTPAFIRVLQRAFRFAAKSEHLVTVSITPTEPNTGYGYLELGEEIESGVIVVRRFVEKPSKEQAEEFVRAGNYGWNGGIFVWRPSVFRAELGRVAPELAGISIDNYDTMPPISIDYAVMERAARVAAIRGDFGWSDVGSFEALERVGVVIPEGIRNARKK